MPTMQAMSQGMPQPWVVLEQMRQLFTVTTIDADARVIPDDIAVLMIVHPKQLPVSTLYAIDQFVLDQLLQAHQSRNSEQEDH